MKHTWLFTCYYTTGSSLCLDLSSLDEGTCLDSPHIDPNLNYQNSRFALKAAHAMNCAEGASQSVFAIA